MARPLTAAKTRHLHLVRAAQSAGEAFAPPLAEEIGPERGLSGSLVWLGLGLFAAAGLVLAF